MLIGCNFFQLSSQIRLNPHCSPIIPTPKWTLAKAGPSAPETGFPPRYASQKAAPSLVPRKSPLRSCALGCPPQRCHSEVPFHPSSSGLTLHRSLQWLLPQTLFPVSAGKIPCGIIRDLTRFEELVVIFMVSVGLSLRKKGHDLLLQSPGQEKTRKWPGITERDVQSIREATLQPHRVDRQFLHRVVHWGQVILTLRVTRPNRVLTNRSPASDQMRMIWPRLWASGICPCVTLRCAGPQQLKSGPVFKLCFPQWLLLRPGHLKSFDTWNKHILIFFAITYIYLVCAYLLMFLDHILYCIQSDWYHSDSGHTK